MRAQPKKGGLRCGTAPKKGVLGAATTRKRGVLGTFTTRKRGNLGLIGKKLLKRGSWELIYVLSLLLLDNMIN